MRAHRVIGSLQDGLATDRRSPDLSAETHTPVLRTEASEEVEETLRYRNATKSVERPAGAAARRLAAIHRRNSPLLPGRAAAHLHADFSHWDVYEQQRHRVVSTQFNEEYQRFYDEFEGVKRSVAPVRESPEMLGKKDELKALKVLQQREEEQRQRDALDWVKRQHTVEELQRALSKQIAEKKQREEYGLALDKAYAEQINFRVAKTKEIDQHQVQKAAETKRSYQSALLEQISQRSRSRKDFSQLAYAQQAVLHQEPETLAEKLRHISVHSRGRSNGSIFAHNASQVLR